MKACPVEAMRAGARRTTRASAQAKTRRGATTELCLGCGVCVRACPNDALRLRPRAERVITPVNSAHRVVLMAIERGKLQDLIFDNQALLSHRAMAAILGVILRLPPRSRRWRAGSSGRATSSALLREDAHSSRTSTAAPS